MNFWKISEDKNGIRLVEEDILTSSNASLSNAGQPIDASCSNRLLDE